MRKEIGNSPPRSMRSMLNGAFEHHVVVSMSAFDDVQYCWHDKWRTNMFVAGILKLFQIPYIFELGLLYILVLVIWMNGMEWKDLKNIFLICDLFQELLRSHVIVLVLTHFSKYFNIYYFNNKIMQFMQNNTMFMSLIWIK